MFEKPVIDLPRTVPGTEPLNTEISETETSYDGFYDELVDPQDTAPEIEMLSESTRGPAVRAPIYSRQESRPERTLSRAAREQIASQNSGTESTTSDGDPFAALMDRFGK